MVPRFLLSPLEVGLDSVFFLSALGMPPLSLRIFEAAVHSDSFLCPDLGLESEHDFDSVSKRAVEITLNIQIMRLGKGKNSIGRFHSRDYRPYWFTETRESICIKIEFNSQRFSLGHQHGRHFFVLGHQHGRRDVR